MNKPWLAALLNIIIPGLGYIYNRQRMLLGIGLAGFFSLLYYQIINGPPSGAASREPSVVDLFSLIAVILLYFSRAQDAHKEAVELKKKSQSPI